MMTFREFGIAEGKRIYHGANDCHAWEIFQDLSAGAAYGDDMDNPEMTSWDDPKENGIAVPPTYRNLDMDDINGEVNGLHIQYVLCGAIDVWYARLVDSAGKEVGERGYSLCPGSLLTWMHKQRKAYNGSSTDCPHDIP